jgi:RimJ/RimL family protein N-acetyltransferase
VLELRPLTIAEAAAIVAGDLSSLRAGEGWPHADTLDGLRGGLRHGEPGWLVLLDGVAIGECGTHGPPDPGGSVEIGYGLAAPFRGRGHGTEVVRQLTALLLGRPDVRRLTARVLLDNVPSQRVLEKNGFVREAAVDGHALYARYPSSDA